MVEYCKYVCSILHWSPCITWMGILKQVNFEICIEEMYLRWSNGTFKCPLRYHLIVDKADMIPCSKFPHHMYGWTFSHAELSGTSTAVKVWIGVTFIQKHAMQLSIRANGRLAKLLGQGAHNKLHSTICRNMITSLCPNLNWFTLLRMVLLFEIVWNIIWCVICID